MINKATTEQWRKLYATTLQLKALEPWKYLKSSDLITILQANNSPVFCSIQGADGENYGITIFNGYSSLSGYMKVLNDENLPQSQYFRYLNSLNCHFGNRDEVSKSDLKIIKGLDLKFRGKNQWIYFKKYDSDIFYTELPQADVLFMSLMLEQLYIVVSEYIERKIFADFDHNQTILRMINKNTGQWITSRSTLQIPPFKYTKTIVADQYIDLVRQKKSTQSELEIDIAYLGKTAKDKESGSDYFPRLIILSNHVSKATLRTNLTTYKMDTISVAMTEFIEYIRTYGKPKTLFVRDEYMESIFEYICQKTNIKLKKNAALRAIDTAIDAILLQ